MCSLPTSISWPFSVSIAPPPLDLERKRVPKQKKYRGEESGGLECLESWEQEESREGGREGRGGWPLFSWTALVKDQNPF